MGEPPPLRVDTPALTWEPAVVTVPPTPVIPPGGDPMSAMISALMPELAAPLTAAVAATQAREQRFAADLTGVRAAYESTDQAGGEEIRTVSDTQLAPAGAAGASPVGGGSGAGGAGGQFGQIMGTAMQVGSQAVQAPMQAMGAVASAPQGLMQGAMQQFGQLSGQVDKPGGQDGDKSAPTVDLEQRERDSQQPSPQPEKSEDEQQEQEGQGAAGPAAAEAAPVQEALPPTERDTVGRHRAPDDRINL